MNERDPILYRIVELSDAVIPHCIFTPPIKRGEVWFCERIAVCNDDTAGLLADVGVVSGREITFFRTLTLTVAGTWYNIPANITLLTEYRVVVCFRNTELGDHLRVNVNGYVLAPFTSP